MINRIKPSPQLRMVQRKLLLYQAVQEEIKFYIIKHHLQPGDPLPPETELAKQLNVSRNSVREAVKSLSALGILEARPGAGLFLCSFSFDALLDNLGYGVLFDLKQLSDVLEVRALIECGMATKVIESVMPEQLEHLRNAVMRMNSAAKRGAYSAEDDRKFHELLYQNIDNSLVGKLLDVFWNVFHQAKERDSIPPPADLKKTCEAHARILHALEKRDAKALHEEFCHHYDGIRLRIKLAEASRQEDGAVRSQRDKPPLTTLSRRLSPSVQ